MKGSSYRNRDYAFGQTMLALRTAIGLTQAGLARHLGVSRKAVGEWEVGLTYPKTEHLKAFITLAVEQQAFPVDARKKRSAPCGMRRTRRYSSMKRGLARCCHS